jgi:hypothetical protein
VAQQVSPAATVSRDPAMCGQLRRDGFPAGRLKSLPPRDRVLPDSGIVVATPTVRSQFGPRLTAAEPPQVIASFGSGTARVDVRMIAPASRAQLAAEQTTLASVGRQLPGTRTSRSLPPPGRGCGLAGLTLGCSRSCPCCRPRCPSGW